MRKAVEAGRRWTLAKLAGGLVLAVALLSLVVWRASAPMLQAALLQATSLRTLVIAIVGQVSSLSVCAIALRVLSPALSSPASWLSRWCRDGIGALPISLPGLGEAAGVRVLTLFGVGAGAALVVSTADILAETVAQVIYAITAVSLAPSSVRIPMPTLNVPKGLFIGLAALALAGGYTTFRMTPRRWRTSVTELFLRGSALLRSRAFAASFGLHLLAWMLGGVQIFLLAHALAGRLTLTQALSLEGIVFALRAIFFFVPGGVGVQELALAAVGASYGLGPVETVALAVLLRLRDVIVLTPGLIIWAILEVRRALRPRAIVPAGNGEAIPCA